MKKKIAIVSIIVLIIGSAFLIYNQVIEKSFRYQTAKESFEKSGPRNSELVEILEEKSIALVIYKRNDGVYSDHIIAQDDRGWSPLTVNFRDKKMVSNKEGFFYVKEIQNKYVVEIVTVIESTEDIPVIVDNLNSEFVIRYYEMDTGRKLVYGFLVTDEELSKGYSIILDGQKVSIF